MDDAHSQIQDELIREIKADVTSAEVTALLGVPVKGVLKLADRPLAAADTPVVIVEVGAEDVEYDEGETPPNRITKRTLQIVVIVSVNASLKSFAKVVRLLSERVRAVLARFRRSKIDFENVRVNGVAPEDYPSETGRQAGHTLHCTALFWSRENDPGTILKLAPKEVPMSFLPAMAGNTQRVPHGEATFQLEGDTPTSARSARARSASSSRRSSWTCAPMRSRRDRSSTRS